MFKKSKALVLAILLCGACGEPPSEPPPVNTTPTNPTPNNNNQGSVFDHACTIDHICIDYHGSGYTKASVGPACMAAKGTTTAACATQSAVGSCEVSNSIAGAGFEVTYWFSSAVTVAEAQKECAGLNGSFTAH